MPTYEYRCGNCGHELEAVQSFTDAPLSVCPSCGQEALRKLFGNVGVVFKGSGFYRNDSRKDGSGASTPVKKASDASAGGDKSASSGDSGGSAASPAASDKKSDTTKSKSTSATTSTSGGATAS